MRRLLKFLHTMGAIGLMGAMGSLLVMMYFPPARLSVSGLTAVMGAMAGIATWVVLPSLALTLIAGLLSIAVTPGFHDAGWAWAKAATGIIIFEGGFFDVLGPIQSAGQTGANALAGRGDMGSVALAFGSERNALWILLGVCLANVALGIWRPRLPQIPV